MSGPNTTGAAPTQNAVLSDADIFAKMTAMRNQTQGESDAAATGSEKSAPVAPEGVKVEDNIDDNIESIEPEVELSEDDSVAEASDDTTDPSEEVSQEDSTSEELIDFIEFAETNPNAKFKFMRNGKEVIIDAKKAAAILGQGGAIHEEARQLKIKQAEFDDYLKNKTAETEGLMIALEFTVRPQIQKAYDEIVKTQSYQQTFKQQLAQTSDPAQQARIQAAMDQNEKYMATQGDIIRKLKPNVEQFYSIRKQQVATILQKSREAFQDKELRNDYVFNEIREKVGRGWQAKDAQLVPGIPNIDLISADEHIMGLLRDGLKYREKPRVKSAGSSIAALTTKKTGSVNGAGRQQDQNIEQLRERARTGDKKAGDNLLVAQLQKIRASRKWSFNDLTYYKKELLWQQ